VGEVGEWVVWVCRCVGVVESLKRKRSEKWKGKWKWKW